MLALSHFRTKWYSRFLKMLYRIDTLRALTERVIEIRIRRIITELAGHSGAAYSQRCSVLPWYYDSHARLHGRQTFRLSMQKI